MGDYKIIKAKHNLCFIIAPETVYIQTPTQSARLVWIANKRVTKLNRIKLLVGCGIISTFDDLFYQLKNSGLRLEATSRRFDV